MPGIVYPYMLLKFKCICCSFFLFGWLYLCAIYEILFQFPTVVSLYHYTIVAVLHQPFSTLYSMEKTESLYNIMDQEAEKISFFLNIPNISVSNNTSNLMYKLDCYSMFSTKKYFLQSTHVFFVFCLLRMFFFCHKYKTICFLIKNLFHKSLKRIYINIDKIILFCCQLRIFTIRVLKVYLKNIIKFQSIF